MATSYPDRTNARGIWRITDIYQNRISDGTYPDSSKSRMLVHGGSTPSKQNTIDFIEIILRFVRKVKIKQKNYSMIMRLYQKFHTFQESKKMTLISN